MLSRISLIVTESGEAMSFKGGRGVPADGVEVVREFWTLLQARAWDDAEKLLSKDFQAWWPHTRELYPTREGFIEMNRKYPEPWTIHLRRVHDAGETVIAEVRVEHPGGNSYCASVARVRRGRIAELVEYWADDAGPAPSWRMPLRTLFDVLPD